MKRFIFSAKVFALVLSIFVNLASVSAQSDSIYVVPAGKRITVRMVTEVNSKAASKNDTFVVRVSKPVTNNGAVVIPEGTSITGRVVSSERAGMAVTNGKMDVVFERMTVDEDTSLVMEAALVEKLKAPSRSTFAALSVAGLTTAGALFGIASSSKSGAAIGALIGAGSGAGLVMLQRGNEIRIATGQEFEIVLKKELVLPAKEF